MSRACPESACSRHRRRRRIQACPRAEVWGLPWRSNVPRGFPGLAYCLGGRSIFWGGWAPELLEAEMPPDAWPGRVVRLMVVPNCHVTTLEIDLDDGVGRVVAVHVGGGRSIPVPERGIVVLAAGTIESTRLALLSFPGTLGHELIGTNLLSHMRSNYTFRIPRQALAQLPADVGDREPSAVLVRAAECTTPGTAV